VTSVTVIGACAFGVAVVVLFALLAWRHRNAARPAGRHRRLATRRLLPADTQVTAVVNDRTWHGIVERPTTGTDRNSGVSPVHFPFGIRLMCAEDVTVVIDSSLVGSR
jgi:hypothetical protein